ncbi:purine-cytosine permease family protein [Cryptosporangium aurantiacum]|uniref:Nucleobase:cation symporter-1, NCS1 family n=1 Tax=Cryptosporangium aurantiacum TaxID=134849 RepID=A0A1M7NDX8_9ACTN|nr:cytosine permease [Cryptosporangium aurantiacum]SHN01829.1 nucleobase:cation symporter-1, NCS1 family [Cryptosporangium aurantiacum]
MSDTALSVEVNGINQIAESERKGSPRDLFWPWFAANVSVLGVSYGSYILGFGISFWQAALVGVVGVVISFLFVGIISIAGKRGSAPTMTLTRAAFGVRGGRLPSLISWLLTVGWETSLVVVAVLATATIFDRLGAGGGTGTKVVALIVIVAMVALGGTLGFNLIMRAQRWITWIAGLLTAVYLVFAADNIDFGRVVDLPGGSAPAVIGAFVFTMTGFGLGWVNAAADYSRYLPRSASTRGVVLWTTLGSSLPPVVLLLFGILLAGSSDDLNAGIAADPVGALTTILPTWFLVPFAVATILGLVAGAIMDVYSSGLALLNVGLRVPRWVAVCIDSTLMLIGAVYVVFFANDFLGPFQGFLITLGVPIAAWCGIFIADIALRKKDYAEDELFTPSGRYGDVRWVSVGLVVVGSIVGWGLVTNTLASWLDWQGYFLGPLGGKSGDWAFANLGVLVSLVIGFVGYLLLGRGAVRGQEALPTVPESPVTEGAN